MLAGGDQEAGAAHLQDISSVIALASFSNNTILFNSKKLSF